MAGRPRQYTDKETEILALFAQGNTVREIEHKLGVPKSTVHRIIRRNSNVVVLAEVR